MRTDRGPKSVHKAAPEGDGRGQTATQCLVCALCGSHSNSLQLSSRAHCPTSSSQCMPRCRSELSH